jgi:RecB family endonuclease NucS
MKLSKIKHVGLRDIWAKESGDFTPWLAENIKELGEALGMDLELQAKEASVGDFALDLLAKDNSGRTVVIENGSSGNSVGKSRGVIGLKAAPALGFRHFVGARNLA